MGKTNRQPSYRRPTAEAVAAMREMRQQGASYRYIAQAFGVSPSTARNICVGAHRGPVPEGHRVAARPFHRSPRLVDAPERLWSRLDRQNDNACWEWPGSRCGSGYGTIQSDGRQVLTHRAAYELANGPIPAGMLVLHRCDNRPCCNPNHLFLGTAADNARDCVAKGRHRNQFSEAA